MNVQIQQFKNLTQKEKTQFYKDLKIVYDSSKDMSSLNMWNDSWHDKKNTLPYLLENTNRFNENGEFHIIYDNKEFVGCGGIYRSEFSNFIALAGTRTWINFNYRNKLIVREYLLPIQKQWAIDNKYKQVALCFNDYNKNIITMWKRNRLGESRSERLPKHMFYNGIEEIEFPVTIQYTKQWVIYEKLDFNWDYDWSLIKSL